uniref:Uncharacterized protein n=1 Tax=Kalanchoe fedtschenkoi TaxID=63787 RepID=A0A7N0R9Z5_KALFE
MEGGDEYCVKVAAHVRALIGDEKVQGCVRIAVCCPRKALGENQLLKECESLG